MKILYLHQYFKKPTENGGTRSYDLATSFVKNGFEVEVITTTSNIQGFNGKKWMSEIVDGVIVNYLYLPYDNSFSFIRRAWVFFLFLWYSSVKVLTLKGDIVLATSTPLTIGIPALIKKLIHKTPYIFEVRDVWPEAVIAIGAIKNKMMQKLLYWLEYTLYKNAKFVVPLSTDMQKSILTRYPILENKVQVVIENISEIERFASCIEDKSNKNDFLQNTIGFIPKCSILYAGTFGKVNQIEYVLDLAKKILPLDASIVFLLLGTGAEKENLINQAINLGVFKKNVFFLDPVGKKDLPHIYKNVSMGSSFVAPLEELWANSANKFFDTLAAGKPILINHFGWQSEVISEYKLGYVLDPVLDHVKVQDFISFILNENQMEQYGANARKVAADNYSLQVAVKKYINLLNQAIKN